MDKLRLATLGIGMAAMALGWSCGRRYRLERLRARQMPWWLEGVVAALVLSALAPVAFTLPDPAGFIPISFVVVALGGVAIGVGLWQFRDGYLSRRDPAARR